MAKRKRAFVVGILGQDGQILRQTLENHGYEVFGTSRLSENNTRTPSQLNVFFSDISSENDCFQLLNTVKPDQIFHAAAVHGGHSDMTNVISEHFDEMTKCHVGITHNILRWQLRNPQTTSHFFLSSQMFLGYPNNTLIREDTLPRSINHYGKTKVDSWNLIETFRSNEGIRAFGYILFNHASRFTKPGFLAHNLATQIIQLLQCPEKVLKIENANQLLDVSHSQDFMHAIISCGDLRQPEDFILANDEFESLGTIASLVAETFRISSNKLILLDSVKQLHSLKGDSTKIKKVISWTPRLSFVDAIIEIVMGKLVT